MIKNIIFFSILFSNIFFISFFQKTYLENDVKIIIEPGMKLNEISSVLKENNLIKNKFIFELWIKINLLEKKLKYGEYLFDKKVSINLIQKKLVEGKSLNRKITVIEGWSKKDLLFYLNSLSTGQQLNIGDIPDDIVANTYFYNVSNNNKQILDIIISKSQEISSKIWEKRDITIPLKTISEMFILASIVEKETSLKREKPIISGVFYNRIEKKMRLQSDPTVVYAITQGKRKMERKLTRKDLKIKSKFNTYVNRGLPPSPICFPGVESLKGTAKPYNSNYFYFVSKNLNGGHFFSSTYKEHLEYIRSIKRKKNE